MASNAQEVVDGWLLCPDCAPLGFHLCGDCVEVGGSPRRRDSALPFASSSNAGRSGPFDGAGDSPLAQPQRRTSYDAYAAAPKQPALHNGGAPIQEDDSAEAGAGAGAVVTAVDPGATKSAYAKYDAFDVWAGDEVAARASQLRGRGAGLREADVFHQPCHLAALALAAGKAKQQIVHDSLVLAQEGLGFHAQLVEDVFARATMDRSGALEHDKGADAFPALRLFQAMQSGSAQRVCRAVEAAVRIALDQPDSGGGGTVAQELAHAARDLASKGDGGATQDVPQVLDGMRARADLGDLPGYDDARPLALLPKADQATIQAMIDIVGTSASPTPAAELAAVHISGDHDLWAREATGSSGWAKKICEPSFQGYIKGLHLLYARCVVASAGFHADMDRVFEGCCRGGGCTVVHAPMKRFARAEDKAKDASDTGYGRRPNPWAHFKDVLRVAARFTSVAGLVAGYAALAKAHTPVGVQSRLGDSTHDVLVIIRYQGLLVEVQLHLGFVLDLHTLSRAAEGIVAADSADLLTLRARNLVAYPWTRKERMANGSVASVAVRFLEHVAP